MALARYDGYGQKGSKELRNLPGSFVHGGTKRPQGKQRLHAGRPWQKVAVDLVGPMPETARENRWILVLVKHFTRWQDALAIPDATAPVVAAALDERVFCYMGLPEQIHTDQRAQFE